jgi:hypothetical protein
MRGRPFQILVSCGFLCLSLGCGETEGGTSPSGREADAAGGDLSPDRDAAVVVPTAPPTSPPTDAPTTPPTDAPTTPPTAPPTSPPTAPPTSPPAVVEACDELPAATCFSNDDCAPNEACLDQGGPDDDVPCCVVGPRGPRALGEACDPPEGERQCASALCVEGSSGAFCTGPCATPDDCPETLPRCLPIAFSGSDRSFCLPED